MKKIIFLFFINFSFNKIKLNYIRNILRNGKILIFCAKNFEKIKNIILHGRDKRNIFKLKGKLKLEDRLKIERSLKRNFIFDEINKKFFEDGKEVRVEIFSVSKKNNKEKNFFFIKMDESGKIFIKSIF